MHRFRLRVEEQMQSMLGRVSVEPGRQVYRSAPTLPARFAQNRVALVGEAAHVFPPNRCARAQPRHQGCAAISLQLLRKIVSDPGAENALCDL